MVQKYVINFIKSAKNHFLLLKKLKNTGSAQLCLEVTLELHYRTANHNTQPTMPMLRGGFLKIVSVAVTTYAGVKTGF